MNETTTSARSVGRMLSRGAMKRCPACGAGRLFSRWFRMADRCPGCGYQFARQEGFFLGAYVVNLVIAQALVMALAVIPTIAMLNAMRPVDEVEPSDVRLDRQGPGR